MQISHSRFIAENGRLFDSLLPLGKKKSDWSRWRSMTRSLATCSVFKQLDDKNSNPTTQHNNWYPTLLPHCHINSRQLLSLLPHTLAPYSPRTAVPRSYGLPSISLTKPSHPNLKRVYRSSVHLTSHSITTPNSSPPIQKAILRLISLITAPTFTTHLTYSSLTALCNLTSLFTNPSD